MKKLFDKRALLNSFGSFSHEEEKEGGGGGGGGGRDLK